MKFAQTFRTAALVSATVLLASAPVAFADSGKIKGGVHVGSPGTPDAPAATHSREVQERKVAPSGSAPDTGRWVGNTHTDPGGSPDTPAASHSRTLMDQRVVSSGMGPAKLWTPPY